MNLPRNLHLTLLAAATAFGLSSQAVLADGFDCDGPCYEKDLRAAPIHRTWKRRIEIERGAYEVDREPSLYGWVTKKVMVSSPRSMKDEWEPTYRYVRKRVLLRPYKNIAIYHKARHKYVRERVVIQPESSGWVPERRRSWKD